MKQINRTSEIEYEKLEDDLLPILKERVFHITPFQSFELIKSCGFLKQNKDGKFGYNYSRHSYGRKRGYICFFDLRNKTEYQINNALECWYFLAPQTFGDKFVFLFPTQEVISKLIYYEKCYQETGCTYSELCIPHVECWHDGDISYCHIGETLTVNINNRPSGSFFSNI